MCQPSIPHSVSIYAYKTSLVSRYPARILLFYARFCLISSRRTPCTYVTRRRQQPAMLNAYVYIIHLALCLSPTLSLSTSIYLSINHLSNCLACISVCSDGCEAVGQLSSQMAAMVNTLLIPNCSLPLIFQ